MDEDDESGPGSFSTFTYTAASGGTYYLQATSYGGSGSGDYGISVTAGSVASYDVEMGAGALMRYNTSWASLPDSSVNVTWGIRGSGTARDAQGNTVSLDVLNSVQIAAIESVMDQFEGICGLDFTRVAPSGTTTSATMLFGGYVSTTDGAGAYAYYPGSTSSTSNAGDVWLNNNWVSTTSLPVGTYSHFVLLHEIGHAVGLAHPGDYNAAPGVSITYNTHAQFIQDSHQYSVMSYFDESHTTTSVGGYPDTLMIGDIYALHQLYGANYDYHAGDSVYGFNSNLGAAYDFDQNGNPLLCIWDGAGNDTLDVSEYGMDQVIHLTAGMFSDVGGYLGNISVAIGALIENAVGGTGDDLMSGNEISNALSGGDGNDTLTGNAGHDTLRGGEGDDTMTGGTGADSLVGNLGNDTMAGGSSTDILRGDDGHDSLTGGTGNDTLYGGDGNDTLYGNSSLDTLYGGDGADYISSGDGVDFVNGEGGNDTIYGRSGWDSLQGGADNDSLYGSSGDDTLEGGTGDDWLSGGSAADTLLGDAGNDTLYGNFGADDLTGGADNDILYGGSGYDTLRGSSGNDTLQGNEGADRLEGGTGDDLLRGGTNFDTFVFNTGHDNDEINDFNNAGDILMISTALVGGVTDAAQVIATHGSIVGGMVQFDFGSGDVITLSNMSSLTGLEDNFAFF